MTPFIDNKELQCTAMLKPENDYVWSFTVVPWFGTTLDGSFAGYRGEDESGSSIPVDNFEQGDPSMSGTVKWDGCSDWNFYTEKCLMHGCHRGSIERFGKVMLWVYDECAKALGDRWQG